MYAETNPRSTRRQVTPADGAAGEAAPVDAVADGDAAVSDAWDDAPAEAAALEEPSGEGVVVFGDPSTGDRLADAVGEHPMSPRIAMAMLPRPAWTRKVRRLMAPAGVKRWGPCSASSPGRASSKDIGPCDQRIW
jgi:hypothetical protein